MTDFNFEENASVPSADFETKVPEQFRGLYAPANDEGNHKINEASQALVTAYTGTTKSLAGVRADKEKAFKESAGRRTALKAVDDFALSLGLEVGDDGVTAALQGHLTELQDKVKGGAQMKIDLDKINKEWGVKVTGLETNHAAELAERDAAVSKHLIGNVARACLEKHGGAVELLLPHVLAQTKVVREQADDGSVDYVARVMDSDGSPRSNGQGGWLDIDGLVADMKTKDAFAPGFAAKPVPGVGAQPGTASRPTIRPQETDKPLTAREKIAKGLKLKQYNSGTGMGSMVNQS